MLPSMLQVLGPILGTTNKLFDKGQPTKEGRRGRSEPHVQRGIWETTPRIVIGQDVLKGEETEESKNLQQGLNLGV